MVLVGELSKFPFPSLRAPEAGGRPSLLYWVLPAVWAAGSPLFPGRGGGEHPRAVLRSAVGARRLGSWLHKHPHPSTCPRHPSLLAAAGLCTLTRRVPKLFLTLACNPWSEPEGRDKTLLLWICPRRAFPAVGEEAGP